MVGNDYFCLDVLTKVKSILPMRVDDNLRQCVAFLTIPKIDGTYVLAGTCFFVGNPISGIIYIVTAKHVIEGIKNKGVDNAAMRLNLGNGGVQNYNLPIKAWIYHKDKNVDVAVFISPGLPNGTENLALNDSILLDEKYILQNQIGPGDEVFITGLFSHHHGNTKNIPIVRTGNIAAMPGEKIQTKHHLMDGYLIEARSISGLSGSPVFTNLSLNSTEVNANRTTENHLRLLGLVYGHFDTLEDKVDDVVMSMSGNKNINVGIAIVTPITKLIEMFNYPEVKRAIHLANIYVSKNK